MIYILNSEKKNNKKKISNFNVEVIFLRVSVLIFRKMRGYRGKWEKMGEEALNSNRLNVRTFLSCNYFFNLYFLF